MNPELRIVLQTFASNLIKENASIDNLAARIALCRTERAISRTITSLPSQPAQASALALLLDAQHVMDEIERHGGDVPRSSIRLGDRLRVHFDWLKSQPTGSAACCPFCGEDSCVGDCIAVKTAQRSGRSFDAARSAAPLARCGCGGTMENMVTLDGKRYSLRCDKCKLSTGTHSSIAAANEMLARAMSRPSPWRVWATDPPKQEDARILKRGLIGDAWVSGSKVKSTYWMPIPPLPANTEGA